jgi:PAS domain-containing protein
MILLDIGTVLFSYVVSNAICLAVVASLWSHGRQRAPGLGFWLVDFTLQFLALVLIALRGFIPTLSILLGPPLIITGTLLLYMGLERYVGKRSPQIVNYILLALLVAAHGYFSLVTPSLPARNIVLSAGLLVFSAQAAWLMLRRADAGLQRHTTIVGVIFVLYCLVSILRIVVDLSVPQTNDLFKSGQYDVLAILIYEMSSISLVFALYSLVNKRLLADLKNDQVSLQDSETRYRSLFENMLNGFAYCQMLYKDGKPDDFVYLVVNDAFEKLTGLKDVTGKKVSQGHPRLASL